MNHIQTTASKRTLLFSIMILIQIRVLWDTKLTSTNFKKTYVISYFCVGNKQIKRNKSLKVCRPNGCDAVS